MPDTNTEHQEIPFKDDLESLGFGKSTEDILNEAKAEQVKAKAEQPAAEPQEDSKTATTEPVETSEPAPDEAAPESLTIEQIKEIYGDDLTSERLKEVKKYYDDREKWERKLKQKAMGISFLKDIRPDQEELLMARLQPFIAQQEQLPETPDDLITDAVNRVKDILPETIKHVDADGYEVEVPQDKIMPHVQKVIGAVLKSYLPELSVLRNGNKDMQEKMTEYQTQIQTMEQANGMLVLESFFSKNPQHKPTLLNDDESSVEALLRIEESGYDHPEYDKYLKFQAAGELAKKSLTTPKPLTFEQAWERLYGKIDRDQQLKQEAARKTKEAQQQPTSETPGESVPPNPDAEVLAKVPESHMDKVNKLFS